MGKRFWATHGFRRRDVVLWLTLFSHMMATFGFPLPAPNRISKDASIPFPCQNRPCGCLTAAECWKGDCCCFTLEEKLHWAEGNGIEPPEHVRPLVESRKARRTSPKPKKRSCCSEAEPVPKPSASAKRTCHEKHPPTTPSFSGVSEPADSACCKTATTHVAEPIRGCPRCAAKSQSNYCEKDKRPPPTDLSGVRWVVGIFAQKCRGEGPVGPFQLEPAVAPDLAPFRLAEPERGEHVAPRSDPTVSLTHSPPTRPPRSH